VRVKGLEPPRLAAPDPKSGASANFATPATPTKHNGFLGCGKPKTKLFGPWHCFVMDQLEEILGRTRFLARTKALDVRAATQLAIDRAAEVHHGPLDEALLSAQANLELTGLGVLQPLLDDPEIEEIWINRPNEIHYFGANGHKLLVTEVSATQIRNLCFRMLSFSRRRVDRMTPYVDAALKDGSRLHIVIPEVTSEHWAINIRKFNKPNVTLAQLQELGSVTHQQVELLSDAMITGKSVLVSGATQAGKTTLMTAMLAASNSQDRIISCEDTFELSLNQSDWVAMQTRPAGTEGAPEISLRELVRQALRMRPDRLVIGEVRGAEALDMLIALNSGIPGLCTLHADSAKAAIRKVMTLPLLAGENISDAFLRPTVLGAFDLVVFCSRDELGQRKVSEILEVTSELL
jgi:pilus assembly protein CpaF